MGDSKSNSLGKIKKIESLKIDNYIDTFNNKNDNNEDNNADFDKHFNIIYGLNGSGKTSLSRLIGSFSTKYRDQDSNSNNSVDNKSVKGSIVYDENKKISNSDLDKKFENIFIFNSDYIQNNIAASKQDGGKLQDDNDNSIILGEEEIKENEEIQKNEKEIKELDNELKNIIGCEEENIKGSLNIQESIRRDKDKSKTDIIKKFQNSVTSDTPINNSSFKSTKAEEFLNQKITNPATTLNANNIKEYKQKINNLAKSNDLTRIDKINGPEQVINNYQKLFENLKNILDSKKITSKEEIERFTDNPSLNRWARDIFDEIKNQKLSDSKCPICASEKIITDDKEVSSFKEFYDEKLTAYFNEEKENFNTECKNLKGSFKNTGTLDTIVSGIPTYTKFLTDNNNNEYREYRDNIDKKIKLIKELCNGKVIEIIVKKEASCVQSDENYTDYYETLKTEFDNYFKDVKELINNINKLIERNNSELESADKIKEKSEKDIKTYYYFNNYKEKYDNAVKECKEAEEEFKEEKEKQTNIENEINKKNQKNKEIEEELKKLKRKDTKDNLVGMMKEYVKKTQLNINIEYDNEKIILKRDNNTIPLHRLSEGEKNILLFIYFIVRINIYTGDKEGDKEGDKAKKNDAIVVIDDPHSSLDDLYIDTIYNLIDELAFKKKEEKKENIQVFLLSHNSYFLCKINSSIFRTNKLKKTTFEIYKHNIKKTITLNKKEKNPFQNLGVDYIDKYNQLYEVSKLDTTDDDTLIQSAKPREFLEEMQTYLLPSYARLNIQGEILKYINIKQDIHKTEHYNGLNSLAKLSILQNIFSDLQKIDINEGTDTDEEKKIKSYIQQHINLLNKAIGNNNN